MKHVDTCPMATRPPRDFKLLRGGATKAVDEETVIPGKIVAKFWGEDLTTIVIYRVGKRYYQRTFMDDCSSIALRTIRHWAGRNEGHCRIDEKELHRLELAADEEGNDPA